MFPDFLGIGAQKSGTTWLHENLVRHPQIWLPPVKEMHYLDHAPPGLRKRLMGRPEHLRRARANLRRCLVSALKGGSREDLAWAARYCLGTRNDEWYGSLFPRTRGKITGEICPGYARLDEEQVERVYRLMPNARIIYLIRNPMERAWSALAMHFRKDRYDGVQKIPEGEIEARVHRAKNRRHGEYTRNLAAWEAFYPRKQIAVEFFDDLIEEPRVVLEKILEFLGADSRGEVIPADVARRRNPGQGEEVPPHLESLLARAVLSEARALHARFENSHTRRWLEYTEARL